MTRAAVWLALAGCTPELAATTSIITEPRLLAARSTPAEVAPSSSVSTEALWVDPSGTLANAADVPIEWAFCNTRKTFSEPGPVAGACFVEASNDLVVFGMGGQATGAVPAAACRQFGPDAPEPVPGEAPGRPVDPDSTGGYYQPVRVLASEPETHYVLGQVRLRCPLPGATLQQATEFRERYVANTNPAIAAVGIPDTASPGATVELAVEWDACDGAPCTGSEPYLWFDPVSRRLTERREAMRVSWFATAGTFASAHSGHGEDESASVSVTNTWTAPREPGDVTFWFVLRDDRGGVAWTSQRLVVE